MNIKALRLFLHIMQQGSLVDAAKELHMSTSAASRLLTGLERSTGFALFSRDRQRLQPTAEGARYFNDCYRVLSALDELPRAARRLARGVQPRLQIISTPRFTPSLVIPAVGRFRRMYPDVEIDLQIVLWHGIMQMSLGLSFDVGVVALPHKGLDVASVPLIELPACAIMHSGHRLAKQRSVRVTDLACEPLAGMPQGSRIRHEVDEMFQADGMEFRPHVAVTSIETACQLSMSTGVITIADPLIALASDAKTLVFVPIVPTRMLHIGTITPVLKPESKYVATFKECLGEEVKVLEQKLARSLARRPAAARARSRGAATKANRRRKGRKGQR
jgi:DNA-binding transcriptional LysR family regulator